MRKKLLSSQSLRQWTIVSPWRTLALLMLDYLCVTMTALFTLGVWKRHIEVGANWPMTLGVTSVAVIIIGCLQHRIALVGHEASHHLLHPNRIVNDLLAELLCFLPIFATLSQYRAKHITHHLHPNDPDQDGNLAGSRAKRLYAKFPMPEPLFIRHYYVKFFWPPTVLANLWDIFRVIVIGAGLSPVSDDISKRQKKRITATHLGMVYIACWLIALEWLKSYPITVVAITTGIVLLAGLCVCFLLPENRFRRNGGRLAYGRRIAGAIRLTHLILLSATLSFIQAATGIDAAGCFIILWVLPLIYVFPYLMLLREIYQHGNTDTGEITNSRMIHADFFTRWALLGYGNDAHIVHHLYPNIPHQHLEGVHRELLENSEEYRDAVRETHGVFISDAERTSLLESLAEPGVWIPARTHNLPK